GNRGQRRRREGVSQRRQGDVDDPQVDDRQELGRAHDREDRPGPAGRALLAHSTDDPSRAARSPVARTTTCANIVTCLLAVLRWPSLRVLRSLRSPYRARYSAALAWNSPIPGTTSGSAQRNQGRPAPRPDSRSRTQAAWTSLPRRIP